MSIEMCIRDRVEVGRREAVDEVDRLVGCGEEVGTGVSRQTRVDDGGGAGGRSLVHGSTLSPEPDTYGQVSLPFSIHAI